MNPTRLEIQKAGKDDMQKIAQVIRSSADWYRPFVHEEDMIDHDVDESWQRENYQKREFYLAKNFQGEAIGTVSYQGLEEHTYLGFVYLHTDHVGKGYGKELLNHAKDLSQKRDKKSMLLFAHPLATWAIKAYKKYGFQVIYKRKDKILNWQNGVLSPYYEEGFYLLQYKLH